MTPRSLQVRRQSGADGLPCAPDMLGVLVALVLVVGSGGSSAAAATRTSTRAPWPGVTIEEWDVPEASSKAHVVIVDLTSTELSVRATGEELGGRTTIAAATALLALVFDGVVVVLILFSF